MKKAIERDMLLFEFAARLKAEVTAWYLKNEYDSYGCNTCGGWDNTKPDQETMCALIDKVLEDMRGSFKEKQEAV